MSLLADVGLKVETLKEIIAQAEAAGVQYINVNVSVNSEIRYNQNVSISIRQTKEQRERGDKRIYIANGKVVWNDGGQLLVVPKEEKYIPYETDSAAPNKPDSAITNKNPFL